MALTKVKGSVGLYPTKTGEVGVVDTRYEWYHAERYGAVLDGSADDYIAIQNAITSAAAVVTAGGNSTVVIRGEPTFGTQIIVPVNNARIPNIDVQGRLHWTGANTQSAFVIGEAAEVIFNASIKISIKNDNQSDWTSDNCCGVEIINANSCPDIVINEARGFTNGLRCSGNGSGFAYNNILLGLMADNKYQVDMKPSLSGWTNENNFVGGRFTVFTGVNSTTARYGIRMGRAGESEANNNVFVKPSFEMGVSDVGAGKTFGISCESAVQNHILNCRSEDTEIVAVFDATSTENTIDIGYSDATSHGVTDNGPAGNVIKYSRTVAEYAAKVIYDVGDIKSRAGLFSTTLGSISGLVSVDTTSGAMSNAAPVLTIGTEDITLTNGGRALGAIVDTSEQKTFILSCGYTGNGGRIFVQCYDASDVLLTGSAPYYASGPSSAVLTASGQGYRSGSDSTSNHIVKFHSDVKRAFIGVVKGTLDPQFNSFRLLAVDCPDYVAKPAILTKSPSASMSPDFRYGDAAPTVGTWKQGDIIWDTTPSASGTMGWVCVTAGTPGTWKTFGNIAA